MEKLYVIDTHALLWYVSADSRLGKNAQRIFEKAEIGDVVVLVPTIVLAEVMHILEKHELEKTYTEILKKIDSSLNFVVVSFDYRVLKVARDIKTIAEIHDRIIVATAKITSAQILTRDKNISKSKWVETIW
ncbi:MAG: PIN domain-containing protein [Candidatus Altiarchaeota archaeon]